MSVINTSEKEDILFIVIDFSLPIFENDDDEIGFIDFSIGQKVYFVDAFKDPNSVFSQDHTSWMVRFRDELGNEYCATQTLFVTEEEWRNLVKFIKDKC
ncbi:hypothetical protein [Gottfriedia luciferensis]|uniref:hypothetical protein n=1 Tax=Gottfriedia luciferensis TaxID=178774 RepID=UPI000B43F8F3|nr:hypothetical protein [Gottfriedia luciferensis]